MAAPSVTTLVDDFTRADGLVSAGAGASIWSSSGVQIASGGLRVASNQLGSPVSAGQNQVTANSFGPAVDIILDVVVGLSAGSYAAIWWALDPATIGTTSFSGMALVPIQGTPETWQIRRYTNGSNAGTQGSGTTTPLVAGDRIWINSDGTNHKAYVARAASPNTWTLVASATDATYNRAGRWGMEIGGNTERYDNLSGGTISAGPASYSQAGSDSVAVADAVTRTSVRSRSTADAIAVAESPVRFVAQSRTAANSVVISDALSKSGSGAQAGTDAVSITGAVASTSSKSRLAADSIGVSSAVVRGGLSQPRQPIDSIAVTDSTARSSISFIRSTTDSTGIVSAVSSMMSIARSTNDSFTISSIVARSINLVRVPSNVIAFSDTVGKKSMNARSINDTIFFVDTATIPVIGRKMYIKSTRGRDISALSARYKPGSTGSQSQPISTIGTRT